MKIGFIGFGKLGQPCGEVIAKKVMMLLRMM